MQNILGVDIQKIKNTRNWFLCDGWEWFSITDAFARYILSEHPYIECLFKDAKSPDEFLPATLAYNSSFHKKLYLRNKNTGYGSMRHIDWKRGKPYIFRNDDFDELISSNCMFARKFDEKIDNEIIEKIFDFLMEKK